jgi:Cytochrome c3/FHA domain
MGWMITIVPEGVTSEASIGEENFAEVLRIGRHQSCDIKIEDVLVAEFHAEIAALSSRRFALKSNLISGVRVNGQYVREATLAVGDSIDVAHRRITIMPPPEGMIGAVQVSSLPRGETAAQGETQFAALRLQETLLSKRRLSWLLFLFATLIGVVLPLTAHYLRARSDSHALDASLRLWSSGTLAAAHQFSGRDCAICHDGNFALVRDEKCLACHGDTKAHADSKKFPMLDSAHTRCASCHRDHNGASALIDRSQSLCSDCHQDLPSRSNGASKLAAVSDFLSQHAPFQVNLPSWNAAGEFAPIRTSMLNTPLIEKSGLKFPHSTHLDPKRMRGKPLMPTCNSCHVPEPGGARMRPINMEENCIRCHKLTFDPRSPERQVPHGNVAQVLYALDEFYAKRALEGGYVDSNAPLIVQSARSRPGQSSPMRQLTLDEEREALNWAKLKARQVTRALFEGQACGVCHTVTPLTQGERLAYTVAPVRISGAWFAKAKFTHAKHSSVDCGNCHAAEKSKTSSDVLLPDINNCRACHGGESSAKRLQSTCITCHEFHQAPMTMRDATTRIEK